MVPFNMSNLDRMIRVIVGAGLIAYALGLVEPQTDWGWLGLVILATAVWGKCPAYSIIGFRTNKQA